MTRSSLYIFAYKISVIRLRLNISQKYTENDSKIRVMARKMVYGKIVKITLKWLNTRRMLKSQIKLWSWKVYCIDGKYSIHYRCLKSFPPSPFEWENV